MAFRLNDEGERLFVGPFDTGRGSGSLFQDFLSELLEINPGFRWRPGLGGKHAHTYLALGYEEDEDLGVMSWGGWDEEYTLYSPRDFLRLVSASNSREGA